MARGSDADGCIGCFVLLVVAAAIISFGGSVLDDEASKPEPKPEPLQLEKAVVLVTGDDGELTRSLTSSGRQRAKR